MNMKGRLNQRERVKPGASPYLPNYNEFNLRPHPFQIVNDLSSCSSLDSRERKEEKEIMLYQGY